MKEKRTKLLTLKASEKELTALKEASKQQGLPVSELVRMYGINRITKSNER